jgi:formate dehydrogenase subunit gamma
MLRRPDGAVRAEAGREARQAPGRLLRFTRGERWVHRSTALLMGICLVTAAFLYVGPLAVLVGRRQLMRTLHVYAGIALPLPLLAGWVSAAFRDDLRRLNRFSPHDWRWLRSRDRRSGRIPVGKFNAGQKLNGAFTAGSILVLLVTGLIMRFPKMWPLAWRTGSTFVHDWLALAVFVVLLGHGVYAAKDPAARAGMRTGFVSLDWARREHGAWAEERASRPPSGPPSGPPSRQAGRPAETATGPPVASPAPSDL